MFCNNCGCELYQGSKFCFACDTPVQNQEKTENLIPKNPLWFSRLRIFFGAFAITIIILVLAVLFYHADFHLRTPKTAAASFTKASSTAKSKNNMKFECR
jgi:uncharacterized membrane protein YvbJ